MNFEFIRECRLESDELQAMYDNVLQELERAEHYYWRKPQECGIILRQTTERICRIYNTYYQIGYPQNASLEEFLCYTDENEHNVMVSRFLSVVRKEQRDRLNKLRVLCDGTGTLGKVTGGDRLHSGTCDTADINTVMFIKTLILNGYHCMLQTDRDLVQGDRETVGCRG